MDRPHPVKIKRKHHQTGSGMEPTGKARPRKTKAYMEKRDGGRGQQLEKTGEDDPKSC